MPDLVRLPPEPGFHSEWSFRDCIGFLYRRKFTLLWATALAILFAALVSAIRPRVYQARASLEVQSFKDNYLDFRDIYAVSPATGDASTDMQTQADVLQQDAILMRVARKLRLDERAEYQGPGGVLERLRPDISVAPLRNSRVLEITCDALNPQLAADLANGLAAEFVGQGIEARQRAAREAYESLQAAAEAFRRDLGRSEGPSARKDVPRPETDVNRRLYESLKQRAGEAWVASTVRQSNVRLISAAQAPAHPYKPNVPLNLGIGAVAGLLLSVGWVMLREQSQSVLREPSEACFYLNLPELGVIPLAQSKASMLAFVSSASARLNGDPGLTQIPSLSESFRATAASILSSRRNGSHPRVLVITSPQATEGKTTVVSNLGIALTEIGNKILLIDGDMRRPRLHKIFDIANSWGLSDILREQNAIDELPLDALIRKTPIPRLSLLPSGASADNIFGLLHSGKMSRLLPRFREAFDYVLIDAPPCLEFADARIMAQYAEQLVLVIRANYSHRRAALAAVQRLSQDRVPVMGFILNRFEPERGAYPYSISGVVAGRGES